MSPPTISGMPTSWKRCGSWDVGPDKDTGSWATARDRSLSDSFAEYHSKLIRQPGFFTNSRINTAPEMNLDARTHPASAQRNIDLLLQAIDACPDSVRPALKLCLPLDK